MKKTVSALIAALIVGVALYPVAGGAQMGRGYGPGGNDGGPGYSYGMGPGMMGGYGPGYGMGPGMMGGYGPGYGMGPGMMGGYGPGYGMMGPGYGYGYGRQYYGPQNGGREMPQPLDREQARQEVEGYLSALRNPNLKVGNIDEKGDDYQVDIVTKDGSLVDKIRTPGGCAPPTSGVSCEYVR